MKSVILLFYRFTRIDVFSVCMTAFEKENKEPKLAFIRKSHNYSPGIRKFKYGSQKCENILVVHLKIAPQRLLSLDK